MTRFFSRRQGAPTSGLENAAPATTRPIEMVIGLGNPGSGYSGNRHNVGYWTVNRLGRRLGIEPKSHSRLVSVGEGQHNGRRLILAKPRTFMNNSGDVVRELLKRYKLRPEQALIVYDELDLPVGRVRIRATGGSGGHNGLRSINAQAGGIQHFPRVRIGIGRPLVGGESSYAPDVIGDHVLSDPPPAERKALDEAVERAIDAILVALDEGVGAAMNRFNQG